MTHFKHQEIKYNFVLQIPLDLSKSVRDALSLLALMGSYGSDKLHGTGVRFSLAPPPVVVRPGGANHNDKTVTITPPPGHTTTTEHYD